MAKGWASWAIAALAVLMIIAGFLVTGGPSEGRKQRRDTIREQDLSSLSTMISCQARAADNRLPQTLQASADCDMRVRLRDPFTDKAYRYQPTGEAVYQLCAEFETAPPDFTPSGPLGSRNSDGCVTYEYLR